MTLLPPDSQFLYYAQDIRMILIGTYPLRWEEIMNEGIELLDEIGLFDLQ